jgi:hypothetical protein
VATSKADEYRDKARECEELALVARDPLIQQQILAIAEKWRTSWSPPPGSVCNVGMVD